MAAGDAARRSVLVKIGLATFGILALELALIRWTSGQIRLFAYFDNLILVGAFLGMGLGLALGQRHPRLHEWTLPGLFALSLPSRFPSVSPHAHPGSPMRRSRFGARTTAGSPLHDAMSLVAFLCLFVGVVGVFVLAGSALGGSSAGRPSPCVVATNRSAPCSGSPSLPPPQRSTRGRRCGS
jgi:hypothetical protein